MTEPVFQLLYSVKKRVSTAVSAAMLILPLCGCYVITNTTRLIGRSIQTISAEKALSSPLISDAEKEKIRLVQEMREFTESVIGLDKTDNYTTYLPGPKKKAMFYLTAAPNDRLEPYTWTFPIIGESPFKAFADEESAKKEQNELEACGYDTWLRGADGYSTSGYLVDPILPIMFDRSTPGLTRLIMHELSHSTLYNYDEVEFSESFAVFIERKGSRQFLNEQFGENSAELRMLEDDIADADIYDTFMRGAADKLRTFYAAGPADILAEREKVFDEIRAGYELLRPRFRTDTYKGSCLDSLNNAYILARLPYGTVSPFEDAFNAVGRDWPTFVRICKIAVEDDDPYRKLKELSRVKRR